MARIPRLTAEGEPAVSHVISRTALDGFVLGDVEKDYLLSLIQQLSAVYFTKENKENRDRQIILDSVIYFKILQPTKKFSDAEKFGVLT